MTTAIELLTTILKRLDMEPKDAIFPCSAMREDIRAAIAEHDEVQKRRSGWYVAEKAHWQGTVRFVRTTHDYSAIVGLSNDADAPLIAAAPDLLAALAMIDSNAAESPEWIRRAARDAIAKATA